MADDIDRARSAGRNTRGAILIDGEQVADTVQCVHCGAHWIFQRGSGRRRGWCMNCNGMTCGHAECDPCLPFEKRLDLYEKGKLKKFC